MSVLSAQKPLIPGLLFEEPCKGDATLEAYNNIWVENSLIYRG